MFQNNLKEPFLHQRKTLPNLLFEHKILVLGFLLLQDLRVDLLQQILEFFLIDRF